MAQYRYLDYAGLETLIGRLKDKFAAINTKFANMKLDSDGKVQWSEITGIPGTFAPSSHTQHYTTLTGSTTTKDQAIVSSGTADGWTLKTLGSNAFNNTVIPTKYAGSSSAGGAATSALKLSNTTAIGGNTKPVYFSKDGVPVAVSADLATAQSVADLSSSVTTALDTKAPKSSPALTGTPTAPTAAKGTNTTQIATTAYVKAEIDSVLQASDAMRFKGTLGTGGTQTSLPTSHSIGDTYKIITAGTYAGEACSIGDMIICIKDGTTASDSDWTVVQANIDGAVTGPSSSVTNRVAVFDGTSGKVIKDSGFTIAKSVPSGALFSDTTYTFADGANGSFTVTPKGGSAQTVSIGKPATAGTADTASNATKLGGQEASYYATAQSVTDLGSAKVGKSGTITAGTLAVWADTGAIKTLANGSNGQVLKISNGALAWGTDNDTKVNQTVTTTNSTYPILMSATADKSAIGADEARFASAFKYNPSTKALVGVSSVDGLDSEVTAATTGTATGEVGFLSKIVIVDGVIDAKQCLSNTIAPITSAEITALWNA